MRKVLIIAYYFPPMGLSGVQRTLKFVKYLPHYDWQPVVLTTNAPAYYAYDDSMLSELDTENTFIYRTEEDITKFAKKGKSDKTTLQYPSRSIQLLRRTFVSLFLQPDSRILWKKLALETASKIFEEHEIDAIYATAPPFTDFLIAQELSKKYDKPFIIDYRDLWIDNAFYIYPTPFHKIYSANLERDVLYNTSKAIVINRFMKEAIIKRHPNVSHEDLSIIPHGFDQKDFDNLKPNDSANDKFVLTHSGLFPDDLTPEYFLKGLKRFIEKNPTLKNKIEARFIGVMRNEHIKLIKKYDLDEICVLQGYLQHADAVQELINSDVLWMMITNNIATPSRMYEYFGSGKPILISAPEGNIKELALSSNNAIVTDVKDVDQICEAISMYYRKWEKGDLKHTDSEFAKQFDRKYLTSLLSKELMLTQKSNL